MMAVGSLTPRKNWHRLLDALFLLKNEGYVIPLLAVGTGKGAYAEGLRTQAAQLGLQVCWLNRHVTTQELAMLYRRASALVYPSIFEGFGIPILEAMTIGIPVVTSRGGCFEEVGGTAALYADPLLAEDLANQIRQVFSPSVRERLFEASRTQIQLFSPEKICAEWMDVYWDR
jgi:glycosyltransferase involved in cell wall biosynthesis